MEHGGSKARSRWVCGVVLLALVLAACGGGGGVEAGTDPRELGGRALRIISGSENETLQPIVEAFAAEAGFDVLVDYAGSVDIMLMLQEGDLPYDAVWPANSLWLDLGDTGGIVRDAASIIRQPVVLGVKRSVADALGWVDTEVSTGDILAAAEAGDLDFTMTSATQSNSGATAYLAFLSAFAGGPDVLTAEHLDDQAVQDQVQRILGQVDRSAGSSGWLGELFLERYDDFDAMINYESVVIETNQQLLARDDEPLYAIYPSDGIAVSDSPLAFVEAADAADGSLDVEDAFDRLQAHLLSPSVQRELLALGRRAGQVQLNAGDVDLAVFDPDWGIDVERVISPLRLPTPDVVREALDLYQTTLRKPSYTVFALDYSGSMSGEGVRQVREAMQTLLEPGRAEQFLLQPSERDTTVVIPFDSQPFDELELQGNDPDDLAALLADVLAIETRGGTDIYAPVAAAIERMAADTTEGTFPAVILMTDGQSTGQISQVEAALARSGLDVPVFGITFGDADPAQLDDLAELTSGRVFDGTADLVEAFRTAKGYN